MISGQLEATDLTGDETAFLSQIRADSGARALGRQSIRGNLLAQVLSGTGPIGVTMAPMRRITVEGVTFSDCVDLAELQINAAVDLVGCDFAAPEVCFDFSRSRIADLRLYRNTFRGWVRGENSAVGANLFARDNTFQRQVTLNFCKVGGSLVIEGSSFGVDDDQTSVVLDAVSVDGIFRFCRNAARGSFTARQAALGSQAIIEDIDGVGVLDLGKARARSELVLRRVRGYMRVSAIALVSESDVIVDELSTPGLSVAFDRARIEGGLAIRRSKIPALLSLTYARVGILTLNSCEVFAPGFTPGVKFAGTSDDPTSYAFAADGVSVRGDVAIDADCRFVGEVRFIGAQVDGQLQVSPGNEGRKQRMILNAEGIRLGSTLMINGLSRDSQVHLAAAQLDGVFLDPGELPAISLLRATYAYMNDIDGRAVTGPQAVAILEREFHGFSVAPYRVMSAWLLSQGDDNGARTVNVAAEKRRLGSKRSGRIQSFLWNSTVGFGYAPFRALWWLLGLISLVTVASALLFGGQLDPSALSGPAFIRSTGSGDLTFNPLLYAIASTVPGAPLLLNDWIPANLGSQLLAVVSQALGWAFALAVIAGFVRRWIRA